MSVNNNSYFDAAAFEQAYSNKSYTTKSLDPNQFQTTRKCGAQEALGTIRGIIKDIGKQLGSVTEAAKFLELSKLRDSLTAKAKEIKTGYENKANGYCRFIRWLCGISGKVAEITKLYSDAVGFHTGKEGLENSEEVIAEKEATITQLVEQRKAIENDPNKGEARMELSHQIQRLRQDINVIYQSYNRDYELHSSDMVITHQVADLNKQCGAEKCFALRVGGTLEIFFNQDVKDK